MQSMLPNVLQPNTTDHVPVLADEVRALLALEPGHTLVDGTFGAGGHATLLARDLKGEGKVIAIDRDPSVRPYFERFRRTAGVNTRFLRGDFSIVLDATRRERRAGRRDPARPRRLEHAARPARARVLLRGRRTARHADGSVGRLLGARARQRGERARARADLPPLRRGALRAPDRTRDRAGGGGSSRSSGRPSSSTRSRRRFPRRPVSATATRRSASSRRCGSRSTRSSTRSRPRCRRRSRCSGPAAGSR